MHIEHDMHSPPLVAHIIYALGTGGLENGLVNIINRSPSGRYRHAIICLTAAEAFAGRLPEWLDEPAAPALIHGDMWGGNVLTRNGRIAAFVDPAIYYADPEIELIHSVYGVGYKFEPPEDLG